MNPTSRGHHARLTVVVLALLLCSTSAFADKIHLKSGKVLEGKLKEKKDHMPWDDWCSGEDQVELWHDHSGQCLAKADIANIEKEYQKPQGVALLAKEDHWGEASNGYRTQLIPADDTYVVGKPMLFHLVMQNVSDEVKWYDDQGLAHPSFNIIGPDGNKILTKVGPFQTAGDEEPIDTGEIVTLMESRDITDEYVLTEAGTYSIQFSAGWPESNSIIFEVQPGTPKQEDVLILSLSSVIPDPCFLHKGWETTPQGRQAIQAVSLGIFCRNIHRMTGETFLWQTDKIVDISSEQAETVKVSEYVGKNESGHIYFSPSEGLVEIWPKIKEDIVKSLSLNQ
jgi:hypothetical protein